jgi:hypothetical protein
MLESIATVAPGVILFLIAGYFAYGTWMRVSAQRVPSPLMRTLYRVGADPGRLAQPRTRREIALAERGCPDCAATGACREWLESGSSAAYRSFCPNAALVERLTR